MRILNLYSGIGGNRKLWEGHEITAVEHNQSIADFYKTQFPQDKVIVGDAHQYLLDHFEEFDFIWSSPPCQPHSRARYWAQHKVRKYPAMALYEEIIFLTHFSKRAWVVENVKGYYKPLIEPQERGRHYLWSNFTIPPHADSPYARNMNKRADLEKMTGFALGDAQFTTRKDQILRNCVNSAFGLSILNSSRSQRTLI